MTFDTANMVKVFGIAMRMVEFSFPMIGIRLFRCLEEYCSDGWKLPLPMAGKALFQPLEKFGDGKEKALYFYRASIIIHQVCFLTNSPAISCRAWNRAMPEKPRQQWH